MDNDYDNVIVDIAKKIENKELDSNLIKLSTGVVLKPKKIPSLALAELANKYKPPKVPKFFNKDIGREQENPNDPDYVSELKQYELNLSTATVNTMIVLGTEIVSIPDNVMSLSSNEFIDLLSSFDVDTNNLNKYKLYLLWVKYVAAPEDKDLELILEGVGSLSGVVERDVEREAQKFRSNT